MPEKFLTMRIDDTLHKKLKIKAIMKGITLTQALNEAVKNWLDQKQIKENKL